MQYTTLGKTNLRVSRLGFGGMRFPMRGAKVDRELSIPLLRRAVELGVNYFDSAVGYCGQDSQRVIGEAFQDMRDRVILSTKNPHYNKRDERTWWTNLENSLERLRTGHIDVYSFHALTWKAFQEHVDGRDGEMRWMQRAKEQGLIRHMAFSFHDTAENLAKIAATGRFDVVTLQYNLLDRSNEPAFEFVAGKCGLGIVVMGPVGGGRLGGESEEIRGILKDARSVPEVALRFVLANPRVSVALSGMTDVRQLEENVRVASRKTPLTPGDKRRVGAVIARFKKLSDLYCTGCKYCMPCPSGVNIPGNFTALNFRRVYGLDEHAGKSYVRLGAGRARYCLACGACGSKCPQKLDIVRQLRETVRSLDDAYGHLLAQVVPLRLKHLRTARRGWSATILGKLDLLNMSDNPVHVAADFHPSDAVRVAPAQSALELAEFRRAGVRLEIRCSGNRFSDAIDTRAAISCAGSVDLSGRSFHAAFSIAAGKRSLASAQRATPIFLGLDEQLSKGVPRALAGHSAVCRFAHDDEALHFTANVKDDLQAPAARDRGSRQTDRLTLWIDARPAGQAARPGYSNRFYEIDFLAPGKDDVPLLRIDWPEDARARLASCASQRTGAGYRVEAALPWEIFAIPKAQRRRLAIQVILASYTRRNNPQVELHWTGRDAVSKPERYGYLFLAE